ncbi:MAG: molybdopterin-guanine dinucleotide biosynthesis protein B [Candidatus Heimdallarchaeota archaeon]|nr:molybdopterin-guanine dinucleotide biosynthesis protein B [Candidatus Heimdallarchaeota archaeon]
MKNYNHQLFFIGPSGSGKTTLIEKVIQEMSDISISTVKFMHHAEFTIDPSYKDTRRHRNAGSNYTVCFSPKETIVLLNEETRGTMSDFTKLRNMLPPVDLALVESLNTPPQGSNVIIVLKDNADYDLYVNRLDLPNILAVVCRTKFTLDREILDYPILYMNEFEDFDKLQQIIRLLI